MTNVRMIVTLPVCAVSIVSSDGSGATASANVNPTQEQAEGHIEKELANNMSLEQACAAGLKPCLLEYQGEQNDQQIKDNIEVEYWKSFQDCAALKKRAAEIVCSGCLAMSKRRP